MAEFDKFYKVMVKEINSILGRKAVAGDKADTRKRPLTVEDIKREVKKAKQTRQKYGLMGLWSYASDVPKRFFSERELNKLRSSDSYRRFSEQFIDIMVLEGVITRFEGSMAKRRI